MTNWQLTKFTEAWDCRHSVNRIPFLNRSSRVATKSIVLFFYTPISEKVLLDSAISRRAIFHNKDFFRSDHVN